MTVGILMLIGVFALLITLAEPLGISSIFSWEGLFDTFDSNPTENFADLPVQVDFLDVGQGDCTLIRANDQFVLIDAGENDQADRVIDYLQEKGIKRLDVVIGSHPHSDHIGGMDAVIDHFEIGRIILPRLTKEQVQTTTSYMDLLRAIARKGMSVTSAQVGAFYPIGDGQLEIHGPLAVYDDLNDVSVVARYVYGGVSFWIAGDCSEAAEQDLLEQKRVTKTTVYKVSHHGSRTATSQAFFDALAPDLAVISLGADNRYGHPHQEVSRRLKEADISVYRTDLNGTVSVGTDGEKLVVATQK